MTGVVGEGKGRIWMMSAPRIARIADVTISILIMNVEFKRVVKGNVRKPMNRIS